MRVLRVPTVAWEQSYSNAIAFRRQAVATV